MKLHRAALVALMGCYLMVPRSSLTHMHRSLESEAARLGVN
jgi:hypothetical protein